MNRTRIQRCANHECPNKPSEGTFTVTTIVTREGRPRNITLALCGPCSDYLQEVRDDLVQRTKDEARQAYKREMYAMHYGASRETIDGLKYPKLTPPPKTYTLIGGPANMQRHVIPHGNRVWRIARRIDPSVWMAKEQDYTIPTPMQYDEYQRAYYRGRGNCVAYVHSESFGLIGCPWVRA